jgi:hypothetical protein
MPPLLRADPCLRLIYTAAANSPLRVQLRALLNNMLYSCSQQAATAAAEGGAAHPLACSRVVCLHCCMQLLVNCVASRCKQPASKRSHTAAGACMLKLFNMFDRVQWCETLSPGNGSGRCSSCKKDQQQQTASQRSGLSQHRTCSCSSKSGAICSYCG